MRCTGATTGVAGASDDGTRPEPLFALPSPLGTHAAARRLQRRG
jgi:hypothetical protein